MEHTINEVGVDVRGILGVIERGVDIRAAVAEYGIHESQRRAAHSQIGFDGMEIPIVREEGQQGLRQFDGADANHDKVEYRIRKIWAISVLVSLAIRDAVGVL